MVALIDTNVILNYITDREDRLQDECAKMVNADYLVTCNIKDFGSAKTKVCSPDEFVSLFKEK